MPIAMNNRVNLQQRIDRSIVEDLSLVFRLANRTNSSASPSMNYSVGFSSCQCGEKCDLFIQRPISTHHHHPPPPSSLPIILPTSISSTMIISSSHDRAFFICKELLMTERTYRKDLEVITKNFRQEFLSIINQQQQEINQNEKEHFEIETFIHLSDVLFPHLLPIYHFHLQFLRQLEQRITIW